MTLPHGLPPATYTVHTAHGVFYTVGETPTMTAGGIVGIVTRGDDGFDFYAVETMVEAVEPPFDFTVPASGCLFVTDKATGDVLRVYGPHGWKAFEKALDHWEDRPTGAASD
jgi:hypothetical protein